MTKRRVTAVQIILFGVVCFTSGAVIFGGPRWLYFVNVSAVMAMPTVNLFAAFRKREASNQRSQQDSE